MADLEISYENNGALVLSTLASLDAVNADFKIDASRGSGFRVAKTRIAAVLKGKTAIEGPILWGMACNLSAAEVESAIEADPQTRVDDNSRGQGTWIKMLGLIGINMTAGPLTGGVGLQTGAASFIDVKVNWSVIEGQALTLWAYNLGAQLSTGSIIQFVAENMGVWLRD